MKYNDLPAINKTEAYSLAMNIQRRFNVTEKLCILFNISFPRITTFLIQTSYSY
jgi:hypothetical protein